jgi:DNA polymerase-4/protein ImuB
MMKLLCVLLPHFPLRCEILKKPELAGRPAAVTYSVGSQKLLLDFSPDLNGLERDMPVQQALSRHSDMELLHADMSHYWSIFNGVLDALEKVSPLVEGSALGDVYIGCDGLEMLYPSDDELAAAVRQAIPPAFEARLGFAGGKFPAYLAALDSKSDGYRTIQGDAAAYFKDLSCDLLQVSLKSKMRLHDFGLHTLGKVAELPIPKLEAQFGPEGRRIGELAAGLDDTQLYPRLSEELIEESTSLPSATESLDVLLMAIESLLSRAFARFGHRGAGIRCVELWSHTSLSEHWQKAVHFKEPAMNIKAALTRIRQVMEYCPQPGPVEELGVKITRIGRPDGRQSCIFTEVRSGEKLAGDIKQLELKMGAPQLFKIKEVEPWSRIPERRFTLIPLNR